MKDPEHHRKGIQKKVMRSASKAEKPKASPKETKPAGTGAKRRIAEEGVWYEEYEERLPVRRDLRKGHQVQRVVKRGR